VTTKFATTGLFFLLNFVVTLLPLGYISFLTLWSLCYHWVIFITQWYQSDHKVKNNPVVAVTTKLKITQWYQSDHKVKEEI
jgi:hypothetical protein